MASFTCSTTQIFLFTVTVIFIFFTPLSANNAGTPSQHFKKVYAFGDAETDTGNTRSATGPYIFRFVSDDPYGGTFFGHPTNRYSDGRLMIDFVTEALSLPYLPPYLREETDKSHGVNFAVAGSTALAYGFFVKNNLTLDIVPVSLHTQLDWFYELLQTETCKGSRAALACKSEYIKDALFWVGEIGANDYAYSFRSDVPTDTIRELATFSIIEFLTALLKKGTKYVIVQGIHPTGCLTLSVAAAPPDDRDELGCVASVNNRIYYHNIVLQAKLNTLREKFPQAVIIYADYWNAFYHVFSNSTEYGFKEKFRACCGTDDGAYNFNVLFPCGSDASTSCHNLSKYINLDGGHLTEAMYKILADLFISGAFSDPPFSHLLCKKMQ